MSERNEIENICTQVFRSVFDFCPIRDGAEAGTKFKNGSWISVPEDMTEAHTILPVHHTITV